MGRGKMRCHVKTSLKRRDYCQVSVGCTFKCLSVEDSSPFHIRGIGKVTIGISLTGDRVSNPSLITAINEILTKNAEEVYLEKNPHKIIGG